MSYNIYSKAQQFRIPANRKSDALHALKHSKSPSYISVAKETTTLVDALEELGWSPDVILQKKCKKGKYKKTRGAGDIVGMQYNGEHMSDALENTLIALAPYVDAGSYLEFEGEDMCLWRYVFDGVRSKVVYPTIDWMEPVLLHTAEKEYKLNPEKGCVVSILAGKTQVLIAGDLVRVTTAEGTVHVRSNSNG